MNENYENNENFDYMLPQGIPQEESVQNVDNGQQSTQTFFDMHPFQEYKTLDEAQELSERQLRNNVRKLTEEGWLPVSQQKDENLLFNGTNADGTLMFYNPNIHGAIDPETGRRTIQLINPVTMEKQIGYTIDELPELVVNGLMGGIERNIDGSPKIDEETNSVIDTYLRDWYKDNKDYVDQLSDQDREELFRYLKADHYEDQMKNTKIMFDGQEIHPNYSIVKSSTPNPPKVYTDYINHVVDEAYKSTDQLAWLGGPFSAAYYAPRALQDLLRERYAGALENGTMAILPWAGRGAGLGKQVASFAAAGLPLSAYYAYEGSPEEALITLGSFAAMPVLGKAVHEMNVPAASAAVADMLKEAADKGAIGYYSALAQLSRVFKNATGDMKVLRDKSFKQIENGLEELKEFGKVYEKTLREELSDFRFPQGGENNGQPALAYATTDGAYVPYRDLNANTLIFDPKDQIMKKGVKGWFGDKFERFGKWLSGTGEGEPIAETPEVKPNVNNNIIEDQALKQEKELNDAMSSYVKKTDSVFPKDKEVKFGDWIKSTDEITIDGNKTTPKQMFEEFLSPYMESICNRTVSNLEENLDNVGTHWYGGIEGGKHAKYNQREFLRSEGVTNQNTPKKFYRDIEKRFEEISDKIKVSVDDNGTLVFDGGEFEELPKKVQDTIQKVAEKIRSSFDESIKQYENTNLNEIIKNNQDKGITLRDILYPEYGKCKDLKNAVQDLYSYKYRDYYLKKSAENKFKSRYIGNTIDALVSAGATGLTGNLTMDDETGDINWFPSIAAGIAAPIALRGAKRSLLGTTSKIGERITKGFKGHTPTYLEWNPEQFNTWSNMGNYKHLMYTVPPYLTMGAIKADKYDWQDPASTVFLWPFSTPDPNNKTTTFYLRDEEDQQ